MFEVEYDREPTEEDIEQTKKAIEQLQKKIEEMQEQIDFRKRQEQLERQFEQVNDSVIELNFDDDRGAYFEFEGKEYTLNDFISVHNNPWFSDYAFPSFIDGVYEDYINPIYVRVHGDFGVDVYRRING